MKRWYIGDDPHGRSLNIYDDGQERPTHVAPGESVDVSTALAEQLDAEDGQWSATAPKSPAKKKRAPRTKAKAAESPAGEQQAAPTPEPAADGGEPPAEGEKEQ